MVGVGEWMHFIYELDSSSSNGSSAEIEKQNFDASSITEKYSIAETDNSLLIYWNQNQCDVLTQHYVEQIDLLHNN